MCAVCDGYNFLMRIVQVLYRLLYVFSKICEQAYYTMCAIFESYNVLMRIVHVLFRTTYVFSNFVESIV